jgi:hypothetical protein
LEGERTMPYIFDQEDESHQDYEIWKRAEEDGLDKDGVPRSLFEYEEPWEARTTVLSFSETPGPVILSRDQLLRQASSLTADCRALGIKRVFGSYDGGSDESFTYFEGIEMRDGRTFAAESVRDETRGVDCAQLVEDAAHALMGGFDSGPFILHGVLTIDFDACTITDEKNPDIVFGDKKPWEI